MREVCPPMISTSRGGTASALARRRPNAAFASPSLGMARTRTFNTVLASESVSMPSIASRPPFGVRRTVTTTPPDAIAQGSVIGSPPSERVWVDVVDDDALDQEDEQDQDHR